MKRFKQVFLLLLVSSFMHATEGFVQFKGTVYNDENAVLNGALVQVTQNAFLYTALSANAQGEYSFNLPLDGDFDVTISKPGYVQKKYVVSTHGISKENLAKLPVYTADIVLFTKYEGVDYSLFDEPINKYSYNSNNNNIDYDEKYLKEMRDAMREVKKEEREAIKLAREKELAAKKLAAQSKVGYVPQRKATSVIPVETVSQQPNETKTEVASNAVLITKNSPNAKVASLLEKYNQGVTEEAIEGQNVLIIQRVVVKDQDAWIYQKKIFSWGGVACFRDGSPITPGVFDQETSANYNTVLTIK